MAVSPQTASLPSYVSTADVDPYGFYDRARAEGVVWDEGVNAWLVTSYSTLRQVMREDKRLVRHPTASIPDPNLHMISGGKRSRLMLHGEEHSRHHRWFVRRFTYYSSTSGDRRCCDQSRTASRRRRRRGRDGDPEPTSRTSISVRVIAAVIGLPWEDDDWMAHCKALLDRKQQLLDVYSVRLGAERDRASALDGGRGDSTSSSAFRPRGQGARAASDDILALLWAEGPTIMPDWGLEDMQAWVATTFFAGTDTTTHAIAERVVLMLMTAPRLRTSSRGG